MAKMLTVLRRKRQTRRYQRSVYLLPSMFTVGTLFCGYACIVFAMEGEYATAAKFIGVATVLDVLDGRIARLAGAASKFGGEFDSLADVISFGVVRPEVDSPGFPSAQRAIGEKPGGLQHILQGPALDITEIRRQRIGCPGRELFERVGEVLPIAFDSDLVPQEALETGEEVGKVQVAAGVFGRLR